MITRMHIRSIEVVIVVIGFLIVFALSDIVSKVQNIENTIIKECKDIKTWIKE